MDRLRTSMCHPPAPKRCKWQILHPGSLGVTKKVGAGLHTGHLGQGYAGRGTQGHAVAQYKAL